MTLTDNYKGFYLPEPGLQIDMKVKDGYEVYIEEFIDKSFPSNFTLDTNQKLTFKIKSKEQ
ncbi:MAG: hypothetical protein LC105_07450 [Chitinophagales bacterium]|nr:hypothetical protein [Chitinophagales bacterium]